MLAPGARLGSYRIDALIGVGGMGEVYRATDTTLDRHVALKVLQDAATADQDRAARLDREARTLAALNHPNIASIFGVEHSNGTTALIMELVEGPTLADRIAQGPTPVVEALSIAKQIAAALEAAHEKGIIHRDLKPANVALTSTGLVKVLDFGLAKVAATDGTTADLTRAGAFMGTVGYMSPEQARGQVTDRRTDIWAFSCVLYEMLTGTAPFVGSGPTDTLALLLTNDPDWEALPPQLPSAVRTLLKRGLERDRMKRLSDVAAIRFVLEDLASLDVSMHVPGPTQPDRHVGWLTGAIGAAAVVGAAATLLVVNLAMPRGEQGEPAPQPVHFTITLPPGQRLAGLTRPAIAFSADGRRVAYVATDGDELARRIYVWSLEHGEAQPVAGTEGGTNPFFSPDGRWVGFVTNEQRIMKVPVLGGVAQSLGTSAIPAGFSWAATHEIVFASYLSAVLQQLPEEGGAAQRLTRFAPGETQHLWPSFLPDDKAVVFAIASGDALPVLAAQRVGAEEHQILPGQQGIMPTYVSSGHLVYAQLGNLMAVPFDARSLRLKDGAVAIPAVKGISQSGAAQYAVSASGALAYVPGSQQPQTYTLVLVGRDGNEQALAAPPRTFNQPRLSPDGKRVAVDVIDDRDGNQIWLYELSSKRFAPFTYRDDGENRHAVWRPDSEELLFTSSRRGMPQIYEARVDGSGLQQLTDFPSGPTGNILSAPYSLCGDTLTAVRFEPTPEIWVLDLGTSVSRENGVKAAAKLPLRAVLDGGPQLSPDCRWLAYASDESGSREIYVRAFPSLENRRQISTDGGNEPLWNPDRSKHELFYRSGDRMLAVDIGDSGAPGGPPTELFRGPYGTTGNGYVRAQYDVSAYGERFVMLKPVEREPLTRINVVLNWSEELKSLAPTP
jgi:eukaryotic-like serine/threonine-protein kinase